MNYWDCPPMVGTPEDYERFLAAKEAAQKRDEERVRLAEEAILRVLDSRGGTMLADELWSALFPPFDEEHVQQVLLKKRDKAVMDVGFPLVVRKVAAEVAEVEP